MNRWLGNAALLSAAAALYALAVWLRPPATVTPADHARALARPFALPFLWRGLADGRHEESPEALAARGEQLLALFPGWVDGHTLFASHLAFAASTKAASPEVATDRLTAALAMLERAIVTHPAGAVDYLTAMASFVDIRGAQDPRLAAVLAARSGRSPTAIADAYLARAEAAKPSLNLSDQRTYLLTRAIESALRSGDRERAMETAAAMRRRLPTAANRPLAERWDRALDSLSRYLRGDPDITLTMLADDPLLTDMLAALQDSQPPTPRGPR